MVYDNTRMSVAVRLGRALGIDLRRGRSALRPARFSNAAAVTLGVFHGGRDVDAEARGRKVD